MLGTFFTWDATSTASMLTHVTNLYTDTTLLIYLAIGIPLGFYVIGRVIGLLPKGRGR